MRGAEKNSGGMKTGEELPGKSVDIYVENERKTELIRNIVIGIIPVAAVFLLAFASKTVSQRIAEEDALLMESQSGQRKDLIDTRQENKAQISRIYQEHLDTLAAYLPGIVCWGDSLTTGSSGNVSYPHTLQKYLDIYISDIYDMGNVGEQYSS